MPLRKTIGVTTSTSGCGLSNATAPSLILSLPTDILSIIFEFTVPEPYDVFDTHAGPWALGRVCSSWRDMTTRASSIWTDLRISHPEYDDTLDVILREALRRSGTRLLHLSFEIDEECASLITPLLEHAERWKFLRITIPHAMLCGFNPAAGRFQSLTHVIIQTIVDRATASHNVTAFFDAPALKRVSVLLSERCHIAFPIQQLDWFHFVRLDVPSTAEALDLISNGVALTRFYLAQIAIAPDPCSLPLVTNASIQALKLWYSGDDILNYTTLPNLRILDGDFRDSGNDSLPLLGTFLLRSQCRLRELSLTSFCFDWEELLPILEICPALTHLKLTIIEIQSQEEPSVIHPHACLPLLFQRLGDTTFLCSLGRLDIRLPLQVRSANGLVEGVDHEYIPYEYD